MARKAKIKKDLGEEIIVGKQFYRSSNERSKKAQYSSLVVGSGKHRVEGSRGFTCVGNIWDIRRRHMGNLQTVLMLMFKKIKLLGKK